MFSSFPNLFDKNFAIGFLLPVIVGLCALAWLCPGLTVLAPLRVVSASEKVVGDLTYLALLAYGLAILLMTTNTLQYRLVEGYLPPVAWLVGGHRRHAHARNALQSEYDTLIARWEVEKLAFPAADEARANDLKRTLMTDYPPIRLHVLPTRFGNVIRAFEAYPLDTYGVDATPAWPRLASVVSKDFACEIEDARAQVNVFLNLLFILPVVVAVAAWRTASDLHAGPWKWGPDPVIGLVALILMWPVYEMAVSEAKAWGEVVKAAFDTFLPALAKQLGYKGPTSEADRAAFWRQINARLVYGQAVDPAVCRLADESATEGHS